LPAAKQPDLVVRAATDAAANVDALLARPISYHFMKDSPYTHRRNSGEAAYLAQLVRELLNRSTGLSLGVVAFSEAQQAEIESALTRLANEDSKFAARLEAEYEREENDQFCGLFVKNLENVQGDERDWIIFSTTFGRDPRGVFRRNFGVLGQHGGERRLNVAVTRAREKVVLVTSMPVPEISHFLSGGGRRRAHLSRDFLQAYLDYAQRVHAGDLAGADVALRAIGGDASREDGLGRQVNSRRAFTVEVAKFLRHHGHQPVEGTEVDAFALDLALVDARTGLFGLGIECDPPQHELLVAARARELWRPRVLPRSVPRVHRVWSRAWYHDRETEQRRLLEAVIGTANA
jgi:hypothetical protein